MRKHVTLYQEQSYLWWYSGGAADTVAARDATDSAELAGSDTVQSRGTATDAGNKSNVLF